MAGTFFFCFVLEKLMWMVEKIVIGGIVSRIYMLQILSDTLTITSLIKRNFMRSTDMDSIHQLALNSAIFQYRFSS